MKSIANKLKLKLQNVPLLMKTIGTISYTG